MTVTMNVTRRTMNVFSDLNTKEDDNTNSLPYGNEAYRHLTTWEGHKAKLLLWQILTGTLCVHIPTIILSNTLVIVSLAYSPKYQRPDNYILTGLAILDTINGLVNIPIIVSNTFVFSNDKMTQETLCFLRLAPMLFVEGLTLSLLMLLALDRYLALNRPFWYIGNFTTANLSQAMTVSLLVHVIYILVYGVLFRFEDEAVISRCIYKETTPIWLNTYVTVAVVAVQVTISLGCTTYVAVTLKRRIHIIRITQGFFMRKKVLDRITSNSKVAMALVFIYIILLIPSARLFFQKLDEYHNEQISYVIIAHFRFAKCSANVVIYSFCKPKYYEAYTFMLTHRPCQWFKIAYILDESKMTNETAETRAIEIIESSPDKTAAVGTSRWKTVRQEVGPTSRRSIIRYWQSVGQPVTRPIKKRMHDADEATTVANMQWEDLKGGSSNRRFQDVWQSESSRVGPRWKNAWISSRGAIDRRWRETHFGGRKLSSCSDSKSKKGSSYNPDIFTEYDAIQTKDESASPRASQDQSENPLIERH